jgi:hypothetical protein
MKIYFEDGDLISTIRAPENYDYQVAAERGVTSNIIRLDALNEKHPDAVIYTNSIFAFNNMYAWNEELKAPEIFIRAGEDGQWVRIDRLTDRELRQGHNLAKMYVAGEFEKKRSAYNETART